MIPKYVLIVTLGRTCGNIRRQTAPHGGLDGCASCRRNDPPCRPLLGCVPLLNRVSADSNADQQQLTKRARMAAEQVSFASLGLDGRGGANPESPAWRGQPRGQRGLLFAAMPGIRCTGPSFIQYAAARGRGCDPDRCRGASIAARIWRAGVACGYRAPPRGACPHGGFVFRRAARHDGGRDGTNGKTSVSTFVRQIWIEMGLAAVNLGTTGVEGAWTAPLAHTTPEPITLHRTWPMRRKRHYPRRDGGVLARAGPAPAGRGDAEGGGLYQFHAGSSGLSRDLRGLFRRQGGIVSPGPARGRHGGGQHG